jgi:hypothetical protein
MSGHFHALTASYPRKASLTCFNRGRNISGCSNPILLRQKPALWIEWYGTVGRSCVFNILSFATFQFYSWFSYMNVLQNFMKCWLLQWGLLTKKSILSHPRVWSLIILNLTHIFFFIIEIKYNFKFIIINNAHQIPNHEI